jgi:hypothetical protein
VFFAADRDYLPLLDRMHELDALQVVLAEQMARDSWPETCRRRGLARRRPAERRDGAKQRVGAFFTAVVQWVGKIRFPQLGIIGFLLTDSWAERPLPLAKNRFRSVRLARSAAVISQPVNRAAAVQPRNDAGLQRPPSPEL